MVVELSSAGLVSEFCMPPCVHYVYSHRRLYVGGTCNFPINFSRKFVVVSVSWLSSFLLNFQNSVSSIKIKIRPFIRTYGLDVMYVPADTRVGFFEGRFF